MGEDDNRKPKDFRAKSKNAISPHSPLFFASAGEELYQKYVFFLIFDFASAEGRLDESYLLPPVEFKNKLFLKIKF